MRKLALFLLAVGCFGQAGTPLPGPVIILPKADLSAPLPLRLYDTTGKYVDLISPTTLAGNRVLTPQDASYTVAGINVAQTFSAAQTFSVDVTLSGSGIDLLCSGTCDVGSSSNYIAHAYTTQALSETFTFLYGGTAVSHMGWNNTDAAVAIVNTIAQPLFEFRIGGANVSHWDLFPAVTSTRDLGRSGNYWEDGYIETVHSSTVESGTFDAVSGLSQITLTPFAVNGKNSAGVDAFSLTHSTSGGILGLADSMGNPAATLSYGGLTLATGTALVLEGFAGGGTRCLNVDNVGLVLVVSCGSGTGTVTSVGQTFTGGLISVSGSPVTTTGTLALTVAGTSGGVPYFSSSSAWASSAAMTAHGVMIGGGVGTAPTSTSAGTANQVFVSSGASFDPVWSNIIAISGNITGNKIQGTASGTNVALENSASTFNVNGNGAVVAASVNAASHTSVSGSAHTDMAFSGLNGYKTGGVQEWFITAGASGGSLALVDAAGTSGSAVNYTGINLFGSTTLSVDALGGSGTRCVQVNNSGVFAVAGAGCGTGTVTSIATTGPIGGGTITSTGTITCTTCVTTAGGQSIAGTTTLSTASISTAIAGTHNMSGNQTVTGNWYGRTFTGGDANCSGVANGWFGVRTDTNEIQICIGSAMKKIGLI